MGAAPPLARKGVAMSFGIYAIGFAIVIGGLTFAFGEGGGKRTFAGIVFGVGMAVLAVNFLTWLFGV